MFSFALEMEELGRQDTVYTWCTKLVSCLLQWIEWIKSIYRVQLNAVLTPRPARKRTVQFHFSYCRNVQFRFNCKWIVQFRFAYCSIVQFRFVYSWIVQFCCACKGILHFLLLLIAGCGSNRWTEISEAGALPLRYRPERSSCHNKIVHSAAVTANQRCELHSSARLTVPECVQ